MRTPLVASEFVVPAQTKLGDYTLCPISTDNAVEDWLVLTANADAIVRQRGGSVSLTEWPYSCTLEENFKDLAWLETCAEQKQLFSYILRRADGVYAGCVYIYPIELCYPERAKDYDVDFSFWITEAEYDAGKYEPTFKALLAWLKKDWPFDQKRIYLRNQEMPANLKAGA